MNNEMQAILIKLAMEAEVEGYNPYFMNGLIKYMGFDKPENKEHVEMILEFLRSFNSLTQAFYFELMLYSDFEVSNVR